MSDTRFHQTPAAITLRPALAADVPCLAVLATQVFLDTYATTGIRPSLAAEVLRAFSVDTIAGLVARRDTVIDVAEIAGHLVGFCQVTIGATQALVQAHAAAELDRLYVQEPFTHRGIGSRLLARAQARAAERGATVLWLTPWVHNERALRFYAKHAYVDVGATVFRMDGEAHENRVVLKRL